MNRHERRARDAKIRKALKSGLKARAIAEKAKAEGSISRGDLARARKLMEVYRTIRSPVAVKPEAEPADPGMVIDKNEGQE